MPPGELAVARRLRASRSVIIGGHGVAELPADADPEHLCVRPDAFRRQVELLLEAGFTFLTVSELAARGGAAGQAPPPGLAALSFDDGMENNASVLLPLLQEYRIPATVYVTTGLIGRPNPWVAAAAGARMMTADELRALAAAGVELGAHTVSHPDMEQLGAEACRCEAADSRAALEELTGGPVTSFAYPFCRYGPAAIEGVRAAGFTSAVTCMGRGSWAPLELRRAMITGVDGTPAFLAKLAGVYERVFASRAGTAARVATRAPRRLARRVRSR